MYVDEYSRQHNALITAIHGEVQQLQRRADGFLHHDIVEGGGPMEPYIPCVNLLFTSSDEDKQDQYGRQIERESSVTYKEDSSAHGRYFMFVGDEPNPVANTKS